MKAIILEKAWFELENPFPSQIEVLDGGKRRTVPLTNLRSGLYKRGAIFVPRKLLECFFFEGEEYSVDDFYNAIEDFLNPAIDYLERAGYKGKLTEEMKKELVQHLGCSDIPDSDDILRDLVDFRDALEKAVDEMYDTDNYFIFEYL